MRNHLYLDIETIPGQRPGLLSRFIDAVEAPGQYKKAESIAQWLEENREQAGTDAWRATSLNGGYGQVAVIGWAVNGEPLRSVQVADLSEQSERQLLGEFFAVMDELPAGIQVIGHNVIDFDLRFLWQRAMVLGVRPSHRLPRDSKPWGGEVFDTMTAWAGARNRVSLNTLCDVFGIGGKGDMDGSKVWDAILDGRIDDVAAYCRADVEKTRAIHARMTFMEAA